MNKIINFPKLIKKTGENGEEPITSIEDVDNHMMIVKRYHVEETLEFLGEMIFHNLMLAGFNIDTQDESMHKDIFLAMESMKSMLLKYHNIPHQLQNISDEIFDKSDDGSYIMKVEVDNDPS